MSQSRTACLAERGRGRDCPVPTHQGKSSRCHQTLESMLGHCPRISTIAFQYNARHFARLAKAADE